MSKQEKFAKRGGRGGFLDNVQDTLPRTMSELEKFALQGGGVSRAMSLKHWHTLTLLITGFWLAMVGLYFFPPRQTDVDTWANQYQYS